MIIALLYDLLFALPLSLAAASFLHPYFAPESAQELWYALIITVPAVVCFGLLKHGKIRLRIVITGLAVTAFLAVVLLVPREERLDFLESCLWIFQELCLAVACFVLSEILGHFRPARNVLAIAGCLSLPALMILGKEVEKLSVLAIFLYALLCLADLVQRRSVKEGDTDPKKHLVFVSPFLIVIFAVAAPIKAPDEPYSWPVTRRLYSIVKEAIVVLIDDLFPGNSWDSDTPVIGFSDRGDLGGDLSHTSHTVMTLKSNAINDARIYLGGRSFDSFSGQGWTKASSTTLDERGLDTIETMSAVLDWQDGAPTDDMMKAVSLWVEHTHIRSSCVFSPVKILSCKGKVGNKAIAANGELHFESDEDDWNPYCDIYYRINRNNPFFEEMLSSAHEVTEESWQAALQECRITDTQGYSYSDYLAYRNRIRETYLPQTELSPKLRAYMDEQLAGAESDYDKLMRIQELLRGFRYTERPGDLPASITSASDYLDYFMLEKREGYCSYFATAFVLLARSYGIPARYVQGFSVPMGRLNETEVGSESAHAWPEVYLDGIGWIVFEPTPGYDNMVRWQTKAEKQEKEEARKEGQGYYHNDEGDSDPTLADDPAAEEEGFRLRWYQIVIPLAAGIGFALMVYAADRALKKRRYRKLNERDKCIWICKRYLQFLKRKGAGLQPQETLEEYAERLKKDYPQADCAFLDIYQRILYSGKEVTEGQLSALEEERENFHESFFSSILGRRWLPAEEATLPEDQIPE